MFELSIIAFIFSLVFFTYGKKKQLSLLNFYAVILLVLSIAGFVTTILKQ